MYFFWGKMTYEVEWKDDYLGEVQRERYLGEVSEVRAGKRNKLRPDERKGKFTKMMFKRKKEELKI